MYYSKGMCTLSAMLVPRPSDLWLIRVVRVRFSKKDLNGLLRKAGLDEDEAVDDFPVAA
jgi:hypothetical protein